MHELIESLERLGAPRIAVLGDFMLDRYVYGDVERISPEAPVPVLKVLRSEDRVGGAANVAAAIIALGGEVACIGVAGADSAGEQLGRLLAAAGAETSGLVRLRRRGTTLKTRYVGLSQHRHVQQMLRVDEEPSEPIRGKVLNTIRAALKAESGNCRVLAVEDYDKGLIDSLEMPRLIADARKAGLTVVVDPARISDYSRYRGASVITPNRYEAELASGVRIPDADLSALEQAARQILQTTQADAVVITLDKEGAYLLGRGAEGRHIPTRPRAVYDVAGAGDEVLAMISVALAGGCSYDQAVILANVAGGLEVERFGVVEITRSEVLGELRRIAGLRGKKLLSRKQLLEEVDRRRRGGQTIVFTNGCFDLLHAGHARYLRQGRELGSCLVVAINSDDSALRLKGPGRPIVGEQERAEMLGSLECVDYVTIFSEDTPIELLKLLRPDILVKGGSTPVVVGRELVEGYGGRVVTTELLEGLSTTAIIDRILDSNDEG